jgi:hypothetical protein
MSNYNADVKITDRVNPGRSQFINLTIANVQPGAERLQGEWRGAGFVPSSGGEFNWDGRASTSTAKASTVARRICAWCCCLRTSARRTVACHHGARAEKVV